MTAVVVGSGALLGLARVRKKDGSKVGEESEKNTDTFVFGHAAAIERICCDMPKLRLLSAWCLRRKLPESR